MSVPFFVYAELRTGLDFSRRLHEGEVMTRTPHAAIGVAMLLGTAGCAGRHSLPARPGELAGRPSARPTHVRVAGIVLKLITADKQRNYERAEPLIREAARQGADIVITTECFLDGYAIRDKSIPLPAWRELGEDLPGGLYYRRLCALAKELHLYLVAGFVERTARATYNTAVLIGPDGRLIGRYRKHDLGHELVRNTPGDEYPVFDTRFGKIALIICADRLNPDLVRQLRTNGAEIILCPSGGMWGPVENDHHLAARSRENHVPIVFVHPIEFLVTGPDGAVLDRRLVGRDMAIDPSQIGSPADAHEVARFDLQLP